MSFSVCTIHYHLTFSLFFIAFFVPRLVKKSRILKIALWRRLFLGVLMVDCPELSYARGTVCSPELSSRTQWRKSYTGRHKSQRNWSCSILKNVQMTNKFASSAQTFTILLFIDTFSLLFLRRLFCIQRKSTDTLHLY